MICLARRGRGRQHCRPAAALQLAGTRQPPVLAGYRGQHADQSQRALTDWEAISGPITRRHLSILIGTGRPPLGIFLTGWKYIFSGSSSLYWGHIRKRSVRVWCWPQFDAWPRVRMNGEMLREIHNKMVSDICVPIQWSCPAQPSTAEGLLNVATQHRTLCNSSVSMLWRMYNIRIFMSNCGTLVDCRLRHLRYEIDCRNIIRKL